MGTYSKLDIDISRRQLLKRSMFAGGALLGGTALLAACGDDEPAPAPTTTAGTTVPPPEPEPTEAAVAVADISFQLGWLKLVQFGGHFMAQEMGYFEEENINAEFKSGGPGIDPVADVASGAALLGDADVSGVILARAAGAPLVAIGTIFHRSPLSFISLAEKPIRSLEDMVGQTIGVQDRYRTQLEALLEAVSISPSDIDLVPDTGDPALLINGGADAFMGFSTSQGVALQKQGFDVVFAHIADLGDRSYSNVLYTTDDTLANRKDELIRWMRADQRGHQYAVDNPEEMATIVQDLYGNENGQTLEEATGSAFAQVDLIKGHPNGLLWIDESVFADVEQFLFDSGGIETRVPANEVMTTAILEGI